MKDGKQSTHQFNQNIIESESENNAKGKAFTVSFRNNTASAQTLETLKTKKKGTSAIIGTLTLCAGNNANRAPRHTFGPSYSNRRESGVNTSGSGNCCGIRPPYPRPKTPRDCSNSSGVVALGPAGRPLAGPRVHGSNHGGRSLSPFASLRGRRRRRGRQFIGRSRFIGFIGFHWQARR